MAGVASGVHERKEFGDGPLLSRATGERLQAGGCGVSRFANSGECGRNVRRRRAGGLPTAGDGALPTAGGDGAAETALGEAVSAGSLRARPGEARELWTAWRKI